MSVIIRILKLLMAVLIGALALFPFVAPRAIIAQTGGLYDLAWNTIDGGGITASTGGVYELASTIGQPDADAADGGAYRLNSGFWYTGRPSNAPGFDKKVYLPVVLK
ncbi:MAG: hypothetical protein HYR94_29905 [Chloroflexi bacterium]|nr:hypothetical protein [Chloroflexota bacterium]